eukprot:TRINITY_DN12763_c1_g1_i1.p2 TRINITY_DN12763_c1_g1~~TRINITY_DN12763_c1_g1_i1.p2  ORF type:complete len:494 (-),score=65.96 TRINITY_DN12763_c1_g1_i1:429-1910(-)
MSDAEPQNGQNPEQSNDFIDYCFASRHSTLAIPKHRIPNSSTPSNVVYQSIKDLRMLDSNPRLNLASFVTTWMEEEAEKLMMESLNVNFIDADQYGSSTEIHNRCLAMLAHLYHHPTPQNPVGTAAVGSSEAIMLCALAMKKKWQQARRNEGKSTEKPNLVMGYNVQVCWEKYCKYFDVEERFVPLEEDCYILTPEHAKEYVDENTIGIVGILGSTYNGQFEDIKGLNAMVNELREEKGWDIPIHVDAASGGFVAPFVQPDLEWDFQLENVKSINVSGHKYGLVYPGIGWAFWRSKDDLPEEMIFHTNYLGSDQPSITLNFSRPACHIIAQYYTLLRLGKEGYTKVMSNLKKVAKHLSDRLVDTGHFKILSDDNSLPLVAFSLLPIVDAEGKEHPRVYNEFELSDKLKERGWCLPAYTMAPNARHVKLLRAVIREDMTISMIDELVKDVERAVKWLDTHFTFTQEQMDMFRQKFQLFRLDSNILRAKKHNGVC